MSNVPPGFVSERREVFVPPAWVAVVRAALGDVTSFNDTPFRQLDPVHRLSVRLVKEFSCLTVTGVTDLWKLFLLAYAS